MTIFLPSKMKKKEPPFFFILLPDVNVALRERNLYIVFLQCVVDGFFNSINKVYLFFDENPERHYEIN